MIGFLDVVQVVVLAVLGTATIVAVVAIGLVLIAGDYGPDEFDGDR